MTPGDAEIRSDLRAYLERQWPPYPETCFIEELGLRRGQGRIDLAVVSGVLHGYEIKSDRDRLDRLPSQVNLYSSVLDRATVVVGPKHLRDALQIIPPWWGILRVDHSSSVRDIEPVRPPSKNPDQDPRAVVELLWRDEALALLETREAARGVKTKPRSFVWDRVCRHFDLAEILVAVRDRLMTRSASSRRA